MISHLDSRQKYSYGPRFDATYRFYYAEQIPPRGRHYDTINPFKEARREAVAAEVSRRVRVMGTDYRVSAFDLFTNWLAKEVPSSQGSSIWRLAFRKTYRNILIHIRAYRLKSINPLFYNA